MSFSSNFRFHSCSSNGPSEPNNSENVSPKKVHLKREKKKGKNERMKPKKSSQLLIDLGWLSICYWIMFWNGAWHNMMWSLIWWIPCFGMISRPSWTKGSPRITKSWKMGKSCLICTKEKDLKPWRNMFKHLVHYWPCPNEGGIFVQNGIFPWLAILGLQIHPSKKWSPKLLSRDGFVDESYVLFLWVL